MKTASVEPGILLFEMLYRKNVEVEENPLVSSTMYSNNEASVIKFHLGKISI